MAAYRHRSGGWQVQIRAKTPDGRLVVRSKTFPRKADARAWAEPLELAIRTGQFQEQSERLLVSDLIDLWIRQGLPNLKGEKQQRRRRVVLEWWRERLGRAPARSVKSTEVAKHLDSLDVANSTRNRYKSALGVVYKLAIRRGDLSRVDDPTYGLHERELNARIRWLSDAERERLLDAAHGDPLIYLVIRLAITTGMREGEIAALRWRDIDYDSKWIRIESATSREAAKSGKPRLVPLLPQVETLLQQRSRRPGTDLVFPGRTGKPSWPRKRWEAARKTAGLEDVRFHDLRHTAATLLLSQGLDLSEVGEILGHKDIETTRRYVHLVRDRVVAAARDALLTIDHL